MRLCMLQKADGSFPLNDEFLELIGLTRSQAQEIGTMLLRVEGKNGDRMHDYDDEKDSGLLATCLAVCIFPLDFPKKRKVWELQMNKAGKVLSAIGCAVEIDTMTEEIRRVRRQQ